MLIQNWSALALTLAGGVWLAACSESTPTPTGSAMAAAPGSATAASPTRCSRSRARPGPFGTLGPTNRLSPFAPAPVVPVVNDHVAKDDGFVQLFNGKDLTGWSFIPIIRAIGK